MSLFYQNPIGIAKEIHFVNPPSGEIICGKDTPALLDAPLPAPPSRQQRELEHIYSLYGSAWIALIAVDDKHSWHVGLSDAEKDELRAPRRVKFDALEAMYVDLTEKAIKRVLRSQIKKARDILKKPEKHIEAQKQNRLFTDSWPAAFDYIAERFPLRPYVTNNLELGVTVRPLAQAGAWSYVQYNSPVADHLMIVDYDAPKGICINDAIQGLAVPAWISRTPGTRRGHIVWALATPVLTTSASKIKPLQYLARIEEGYRKQINGDRGFAGLLTKNPISDVWDVDWIESRPYTLDELASHVQIERYTSKKKPIEIEPVGLGRKVLTFERARKWSYSAVSLYWATGYEHWLEAVRSEIDAINRTFECPLPESHCKSIAKSIAKWVWARFTPLSKHQLVLATHTPAEQARRGALKGAKRRVELMPKAKEMAAAGATQRQIAAELAVAQQTIADWLKV